MPRFAANLSMMFQEMGFLERFDAAARAGFKGVEFLFPYEHPPEVIAEWLEKNRLTLALFNTVPGDWGGGERGLAALPGREQEFRDGVDKAIVYAKASGCRLLHTMAGLWPEGQDNSAGERVYIDNLRWAANRMAAAGLTAVIEPINTRDIPGYFLNYTTQALRIIETVGRPNLKLQLDLYLCRSWKAISRQRCAHSPAITRMRRSPAIPAGMSPMSARSIIPTSSISSTRSAIKAGSAANTGRRATRSPVSAGPRNTVSADTTPLSLRAK